MSEFIHVEDVSFSYDKGSPAAIKVLSHINLKVEKGESIALIGANGSGKSTLAKLLNALLIPDNGRVLISGMETRVNANHAAIRASVGVVFQRPQDQIVASTVEEDVAFGPSNLGLSSREVYSRVEQALNATQLDGYQERSSLLLSAGETQRLALAGVLAMQPQCVIFDETTAMLDPQGREMVLRQSKALNRQGISTILITHLMQEAAQCERVLVLHKGSLVLDGSPAEIFLKNDDLERFGLTKPDIFNASILLHRFFPTISEWILNLGELLQSVPPYQGSIRNRAMEMVPIPEIAQAIITMKDLSFTYLAGSPLARQAIKNLNMKVGKGCTHALIGGTGSGKSTLLQHANGLYRPQSGSVKVDEFDLNDKDVDVKALRQKVALAFQQPEDQIFEQYVGDEIAFGPRNLGFEGTLSETVKNAMDSVGLDFLTYKDRFISTLSGGERRKVALASVLAVQPQILLLDEPLSGLDPVSSQRLIRQIKGIQKAGKTICISTHQYEELAPILDYVSIIQDGKDIQHGPANWVLGQVDAMEAAGLKAPLAAQIAKGLREKGWLLDSDINNIQSLEKALERMLG